MVSRKPTVTKLKAQCTWSMGRLTPTQCLSPPAWPQSSPQPSLAPPPTAGPNRRGDCEGPAGCRGQKWKKVVVVQKRDYDAIRRERKVHTRGEDYLEIGGSVLEEQGQGQVQPPQVEGQVQPPQAEGQGGAEQAVVQQGAAQAVGGRARQPVSTVSEHLVTKMTSTANLSRVSH